MATPTSGLLESAPGGLPLVRDFGLNTAKASNLAGVQVDTSGNTTIPGTLAVTGAVSAATTVTGPTGSFAVVNVTTAEITGATGTTATLIPVGAAAGGPTTAAQHGWVKIAVAGTTVWIPDWQ